VLGVATTLVCCSIKRSLRLPPVADTADNRHRFLFYEDEFSGFGNGLASIADTEFAIDVLEVSLDGVDGNAQAAGDLWVGAMLGEEAQGVHHQRRLAKAGRGRDEAEPVVYAPSFNRSTRRGRDTSSGLTEGTRRFVARSCVPSMVPSRDVFLSFTPNRNAPTSSSHYERTITSIILNRDSSTNSLCQPGVFAQDAMKV
jgi:hypothetical protein